MRTNQLSDRGSHVPSAWAAGAMTRTGLRPRNGVLAALPTEVLSSLLPRLRLEVLPRGKVLRDVDEPLTHVYFVERGLVSLVTVFEGRTTAEMATLGREGLVGISTLLGCERALGRYVVRVPGAALAIEASQFRTALRESPGFRTACEGYAQAFLREALQTAACNSVHVVEKRCARWLLRSHDRSDGDTLALTQDYLADILGVCRSTVTLVAGALQRAGMIRYRRGAIRVVDRPGLEMAACECYHVIRDQYERLLPGSSERQRSIVGGPLLSHAPR